MYHPIVKEQVLPGQLEELQTNPHATETQFQSQAQMKENKTRRTCSQESLTPLQSCGGSWLKFETCDAQVGMIGVVSLAA